MLKKRLIPVLLLQNGMLVRSELFRIHQIIGNPIHEVERFNEWNVDELIYLDITQGGSYDLRRNDSSIKTNMECPLEILREVGKTCFMPLTWGGRIQTLEDMQKRFERGADKITLNTVIADNPGLVTVAARRFGAQAIVASIDVFQHEDGGYEVVVEGGARHTGRDPVDWAQSVEKLGAGEILLQSINKDGKGSGYDLDLIKMVCEATTIPVIACSGVGDFDDYADCIEVGASAAAAANIWHFKELSDRQGKRAMARAGINVRL